MVAISVDAPERIDVDVDLDPWGAIELRARNAFACVFMAAGLVVMIVSILSSPTTEDAVFSMELAAFTGLNATVGPTVSPAFTLIVRVENPSALHPWCSNGGEVLVSYSGVALAWGHLPAFCVRRNAAAELTVLPWGWEVGLSEDLRRRLVLEWNMVAAQIMVEMRMFNPDCWMRTEVCRVKSLHRFEFDLKVRDDDQAYRTCNS